MDTISQSRKISFCCRRIQGRLDGPMVSDLPVVLTKSQIEGHLIAFKWFTDTYSFIGNPNHPCVHTDPIFHDLKPGENQTIKGERIFFEGPLEEFESMFRERWVKQRLFIRKYQSQNKGWMPMAAHLLKGRSNTSK